MERTPRVSVVIPCYNYGRYLRQCVGSVANDQPGVDVEIIIVDDKSTDDSADIALAIAAEDDRIRVVRHEVNKGHIATYNDGLDLATGEFVVLLSADDLATPGALTRAAALMTADPSVGVVYGGVVPFRDEPPPSRTDCRNWIIWPGAEWFELRCRSGYNVVASPEVMMRTSLLRAFGGYRADLPHAGDFEMWLRASTVSNVGYLVRSDQAYYRQHAANMNSNVFRSGTAQGQLIDLKQRWRAFEAVFNSTGKELERTHALFETARRTIACQTLKYANYAFARGFRDFPVGDFEAFARQVYPEVTHTRSGRALARRKRLGMVSLPVHPLWLASAIAWRTEEVVRRWRRGIIGI